MKITAKKILWTMRAITYIPFYGKISMPSYIGKPLYIEGSKGIYIGKRVRIFPHIRMETHGRGKIRVHDNVYIGQNCHITSAGSSLDINDGTAIMANVCITNIDHNYYDIKKPVLEQGIVTRKTKIGNDCFIGHNAVIQAGAVLGKHVIVGANSVVNRGFYPNYSVLVGAPAKVVKRYNPQSKEWIKVVH